MSQRLEKIEVHRVSLLAGSVDRAVRAAFDDYERRHFEWGLDWLRHLASTSLPPDESPELYLATSQAGDMAALPLKVSRARAHAGALSNWYSSDFAPVIQSPNALGLLTPLFEQLAAEGIASITLSPLADEGLGDDLVAALGAAGWRGIHRWHCFANWVCELEQASYPSWVNSRPSQLRNTIRRKTRNFLAEDRGALRVVERAEELPEAIRAFTSVYSRSWKQEEPWPDFIPGLIELAARRGWLRLGIADYEGSPIAAQIWLVSNQVAYIFKLAYDQEYRKLSPGTVLSAHLMEHVITRDGVAQVDFMTGDDGYKRDWMTHCRHRHGIAAYHPGSVRGLARLTGHTLKRAAKQLLGRSTDTGAHTTS